MSKTIYNYHPVTGEYQGSTEARPDPLKEGAHLIPAHATVQQPPALAANEVALFIEGAWQAQPDHRGQTYYSKTTKAAQVVDAIGPIDADLTDQVPGPHDTWSGNAWVLDIVAARKAKKKVIEDERDQKLDDPAATVLVNGATFQMDKRSKDELNDALTTYGAAGATPTGFVWRDADNVDHPAPLQLLIDIAAARGVQKAAIWQRSWDLKDLVDAATNQAELDAIQW